MKSIVVGIRTGPNLLGKNTISDDVEDHLLCESFRCPALFAFDLTLNVVIF
jgi:hypothetical protein